MDVERNLGPQPIGELMAKHGLEANDLVEASDEQVTHKMVARAVKGRRLTPRVMGKLAKALNAASGESYELDDLFDYAPRPSSRFPADPGPPPGDAEPTTSSEEARYTCPQCGEEIVVPVAVGDREQQYVEDCPVCCSPVVLRVQVGENGDVTIRAEAE
jgi:hypothetical protein